MNYSNKKKLRKVKRCAEDILLFPVRCICTPMYKLSQKFKKTKMYSEKQIKKVAQYLLDYWSDNEKEFYILLDDGYNPFDYSNVQNLFHICFDISWSHKSIKKKAMNMYSSQKDQLVSCIKYICGNPMTVEEKEKWFGKYDLYKIKEREIYKIK